MKPLESLWLIWRLGSNRCQPKRGPQVGFGLFFLLPNRGFGVPGIFDLPYVPIKQRSFPSCPRLRIVLRRSAPPGSVGATSSLRLVQVTEALQMSQEEAEICRNAESPVSQESQDFLLLVISWPGKFLASWW